MSDEVIDRDLDRLPSQKAFEGGVNETEIEGVGVVEVVVLYIGQILLTEGRASYLSGR